ncbi:thioredoxin domain-containing protein [Halogeometricum borinquense]|uniref:Thioredoxin domain-containing protein n=1 Tax=Halogeometricum borinquense TaxID=60847 RepID=A0A6C0UGG9_9EURY|nr:thioredoxin domain-containing protein [Halogeometricum borinquense]QIB74624.1 thioredoxin domain-containing protein [Halogeometricum borinquense]QIQ76426.1 thioredoxin domain-containing protein [Halogeometricum borinquense]
MSDALGRNRLADEQSPYLQQHADNPVNWQPWDETAIEAAREKDRPIFLSVGYSACHWCHVMADESFEDDDVAAVLNESFVPVKVDREERPDLDRIYQTICQLVTGGGGWPLSVWLTPQGKPFYVGTYFPKEERRDRGNVPGFLDLCRSFAEAWENDREEIENRAQQWTAAIQDQLETTPDDPGESPGTEILGEVAKAALRGADREYGGFGSGGPKFPQPGRVEALLRSYVHSGEDEPLTVAMETLDAMAGGGMYDHVGGGFHRYATDRQWTVPHFEKMLYDNAEIPRVYLAAHRLTGRADYAEVARETFDFVARELRHPDGGFFSTLDAQSGGEEGTFYVWTPEQVHEALADETRAEVFCDYYGVTSGGNFENGTTVLTVSATVDSVADEHGLTTDEVTDHLDAARETLFDARESRTRPPRDEKVLAGWNGLMISSLAQGSLVLGDEYAELAADALHFVREHLWDELEGRLSRRFKDGDVKGEGYLEDYAFLARGAFDLYQATGDVDHLAFAVELAREIVASFYDAAARTLYFTPDDGEALVTRPQELQDQSTPSSVGVATSLLLDLDAFAPDADFAAVAGSVLDTHADRIRGRPLEHVSLALAAEKRARGGSEIVVAGDSLPDSFRQSLAKRYVPDAVLSIRPPTDDDLTPWLDTLGVEDAPPVWQGREMRDGEPTVYACEGRACSPPAHSVEEALSWFGGGDDVDVELDDADIDLDETDLDID